MKREIKLKENPYKDYIDASIRAEKKEKELAEQKTLDFQKWLDSERKKCDLSGLMDYCMFCQFRNNNYDCSCEPSNRSNECVCAKAYHNMKKKLGNN